VLLKFHSTATSTIAGAMRYRSAAGVASAAYDP
jgi:hypothetical protein